MKVSDRIGLKYGMLTVIEKIEYNKSSSIKLLCRCDCGELKAAFAIYLDREITTNCGCQLSLKNSLAKRVHGHAPSRRGKGSAEYVAWRNAKTRCFNAKSPAFKHWGGRGISMCDEWKNDFQAFYAFMGPKPSLSHSLDRIDNYGNYEPGNCRWATSSEQLRNRHPRRKKLIPQS